MCPYPYSVFLRNLPHSNKWRIDCSYRLIRCNHLYFDIRHICLFANRILNLPDIPLCCNRWYIFPLVDHKLQTLRNHCFPCILRRCDFGNIPRRNRHHFRTSPLQNFRLLCFLPQMPPLNCFLSHYTNLYCSQNRYRSPLTRFFRPNRSIRLPTAYTPLAVPPIHLYNIPLPSHSDFQHPEPDRQIRNLSDIR